MFRLSKGIEVLRFRHSKGSRGLTFLKVIGLLRFRLSKGIRYFCFSECIEVTDVSFFQG